MISFYLIMTFIQVDLSVVSVAIGTLFISSDRIHRAANGSNKISLVSTPYLNQKLN
jgi:hypothetical protein